MNREWPVVLESDLPGSSGRGGGSTEDEPARFGGWSDYREWAHYDFRERSAAEEPGLATAAPIVVEALTDLVPIRVLVEQHKGESRNSCLVPSSGLAEADLVEGVAFEVGDTALIRPYVRSGGDADVRHKLEFETMVEAARPYPTLPVSEMSDDQRDVCRVCTVPLSVAEVAVAISASLGLARMIISDSIDRGYLRLHNTPSTVRGRPSIDLLNRVYSGIARLADA